MAIKEKNFLVLEVLREQGIDLHKASRSTLREHRDEISRVKNDVEKILQKSGLSDEDLDALSWKKLVQMRSTVLSALSKRGNQKKTISSMMKKLFSKESVDHKRWMPLDQVVNYVEWVSARIFQDLNEQIDQAIGNSKARTHIIGLFRQYNQGVPVHVVYENVLKFIVDNGIDADTGEELVWDWWFAFKWINEELLNLYQCHIEHMDMNGPMLDLARKNKRHPFLRDALGEKVIDSKPTSLAHDIHAQSAEINRSIIETVSNALDSAKTQTRVDVTTHASGYTVTDSWQWMNPYVILEKLLIPKVSGKAWDVTIGRFWVWFYTVLSHLNEASDFVRVTTCQDEVEYLIEFRIHENSGDIFVHTESSKSKKKGWTSIEVHAANFDQENAEKLLNETFAHHTGSVRLNGKQLYHEGDIQHFDSKDLAVDYSQVSESGGRAVITINGVRIEEINLSGVNVPETMVLNFPLTCSLPESRSELAIDEIAKSCIKGFIDDLIESGLPREEKIMIFNGLGAVLSVFRQRDGWSGKKSDLLTRAQSGLIRILGTNFSNVLPNAWDFLAVDIPGAILVDPLIYSKAFDKVPGVEVPVDWSGDPLYLLPMKSDSKKRIFNYGNSIFMDKSFYESHKAFPVGMNAYFAGLDHSGALEDEKKRGKFHLSSLSTGKQLSDSSLSFDGMHESVVSILWPEFAKRFLGCLNRVYQGKNDESYSEHEAWNFLLMDGVLRHQFVRKQFIETVRREIDRQVKMQKRYDEELAKHEADPDLHAGPTFLMCNSLRKVGDNVGTLLEILWAIFDNMPQELLFSGGSTDISQIIQDAQSKITNAKIDDDIYEECLHYITTYRSAGYSHANFQSMRDTYILLNLVSGRPHLHAFLATCVPLEMEFIEFLHWLSTILDLDWLGAFFVEQDDPELHKQYWKFLRRQNYQYWERMDLLFRKRLANLPSAELEKVVNEIRIPTDMLYGWNTPAYHLIPAEVRWYVVYVIEGADLLTDAPDDVQLSDDDSVPMLLSELVQSKSENEKYFQNFNGSVYELVDFVGNALQGADCTKAVRSIRHSVLHQIVNDRYLWIREAVQNSLDASKKSDNGSAVPEIRIDTFLETKLHDLPIQKVCEELEWPIKRKYAAYWWFFEDVIYQHMKKGGLFMDNLESLMTRLWALQSQSGELLFSEKEITNFREKLNKSMTQSNLVIRINDIAGMDIYEIVNFLLIPNVSSKGDEKDAIGKFGQGFFTILKDAKEVRIRTSKGNWKVNNVRILPMRDDQGYLHDFQVYFSEEEGDFKGTILEQVSECEIPEVEAALCKSTVVSYAGLINADVARLSFGWAEINKPRAQLSQVEIPEIGMLTIYEGHENSITQNGLFIKKLDEEWINAIPHALRKTIASHGLVVDIPPSIQLIKSRNDIAKKQVFLPKIYPAFSKAAIYSHLARVMQWQEKFDDLPYDYFDFDQAGFINIEAFIREDARKLIEKEEVDFSSYEHDGSKFMGLLTLLPSVRYWWRMLSLEEVQQELWEDPEEFDEDILPGRIQMRVRNSKSKLQSDRAETERARLEFGVDSTMVKSDFSLQEISEESTAYHAFHKIAEYILWLTAEGAKVWFYCALDGSLAHARRGIDVISFNLFAWEKDIEMLATCIRENTSIQSPELMRMIEKIIVTVTHERQHNLEWTNQWTHNAQFFDEQRNLISKLLQKDGSNLEKDIEEIVRSNSGVFMSAKELIGRETVAS